MKIARQFIAGKPEIRKATGESKKAADLDGDLDFDPRVRAFGSVRSSASMQRDTA